MLIKPSLLRRAELIALSDIKLNGKVLDLGGVKNSSYISAFRGKFSVTIVNISEMSSPDIFHDLESPLPIKSGEYNHVLLINVLEHIFEYRSLLKEAERVLKTGGSAVIIVPFLFPLHPSPRDYHRFTERALHEELVKAGFTDIVITPLGSGIFSAEYLLIDRLLPWPFRFLNYYTLRYVTSVLDTLVFFLARVLGRGYTPEAYALGFCAVARESGP